MGEAGERWERVLHYISSFEICRLKGYGVPGGRNGCSGGGGGGGILRATSSYPRRHFDYVCAQYGIERRLDQSLNIH